MTWNDPNDPDTWEIPVRVAGILKRANLGSFDEIRAFGPNQLRIVPNCGPVSIRQIGDLIGGWGVGVKSCGVRNKRMLTEGLDRAALAVLKVFAIPPDLSDVENRASIDMAYAVARAVIESLRAPTECMWDEVVMKDWIDGILEDNVPIG